MKKLIICLIVLPFTGFLGGCATIIKGTKQSVRVITPPVTNAHCMLANSRGKWYIPHTPGSVKVHRDKSDLRIVCQKPGRRTSKKSVNSKTSLATAGNVLAGGIIGMGIDAASGADFYYPKQVSVPMSKRTHTVTSR